MGGGGGGGGGVGGRGSGVGVGGSVPSQVDVGAAAISCLLMCCTIYQKLLTVHKRIPVVLIKEGTVVIREINRPPCLTL